VKKRKIKGQETEESMVQHTSTESSNLSKRTAVEQENRGAVTSSSNEDLISDTARSAQSNTSKRKPSNNKKRKHASSTKQTSTDRAIFNGLILAISTLESKTINKESSEATSDTYNNFKLISNLLKSNGATISPQIHKRVHYLVCTTQALDNLTQRVRQTLKRNVDIVHVDWVKVCLETGVRVDAQKYLMKSRARELMDEKEKAESKTICVEKTINDGYESDIPDENDAGWTSPVQLDCCCVCHENGDENCPWCTECNINLAKQNK